MAVSSDEIETHLFRCDYDVQQTNAFGSFQLLPM